MDDTPSRPDEVEPSIAGSTLEPPPPVDARQDSWLRRRWWVLLLVVAIGGALISLIVPSSTPDSGSSAFHQTNLADGETESLAALLVDVPGYRYRDAMDVETENARAASDPERMPGLSLHSVRDSEHREVAFLQLWEFVPGTLPDVLTVDDASQLSAGEGSEVTVAGHDVILIERPENPSSQYMYVWASGDALLVADGPNEEWLTAWLRDYLSVLEESS